MMGLLDEILRRIGNEKLYDKAVIPALLLEAYSRAFNDKKAKQISMELYKISRNVRAVEEFIYVYKRTGDLEKAVERALQKIRKRYT